MDKNITFYVIVDFDLESLVEAVRLLTLEHILVEKAQRTLLTLGSCNVNSMATVLTCNGTERDYKVANDMFGGTFVIRNRKD